MIDVEMTSKDIERETGIRHDNILRDVKSKWLDKYPINSDGISLLKIEGSDFIIQTATWENRGKSFPAFKFNKNAANAFMSNYKLEHAIKIVAYIDKLEKENERLEEENRVLQGIVWQVINGKNYLPQELGAQSAGIERPRLFMKYLKGREHVLKAFMDKN